MTSALVDTNSNTAQPRPNGYQKELPSKTINGLQKHADYRPTSEQLAFIESHNNEAIRTKKFAGYLSDGEDDSGLEYEAGRYRQDSINLSSDSSSLSSDDEEETYREMKLKYEHYDPDKFEHPDYVDGGDKTNDDSDDCNFGKSKKRHILREILHHGIEIRPKIIDDFGGWDTTFSVRNAKQSKSNTRRFTKTPRTSSAFPRPSTESKESSFLFKHYDDISEYIKQYRIKQTVKDIRLKSTKEVEEGILVPDPYATKLKSNMCSIAENCDFLTVYSTSTKEKVERVKEKEIVKEKPLSEMSAARQAARQQPRPFSDHPFIVRTLSVKDRSRMLNLAPVRNQETSQNLRDFRPSVVQANVSLEHYLNLVVPHRQMRRSNSNLTASSLGTTDEKDEISDQKPALHKKNIQLNIDGPCDPWTPKFEIKRSSSRGGTNTPKQTNSAGTSRKKLTPTPDSIATKQMPVRPEMTLSRATTYHSHFCSKGGMIDNELSVNTTSNRGNPSNVQRVYGQRFRCCERIHAMISSNNEEQSKKSKDRHLKLSVDNLKCEKTNPVSFGSFGVRKGMAREDTSLSLSCIYKLKRERQRRFNISLVK